MELQLAGRQLKNGLDELLDLEPDYLLPMFKTSEVAAGRVDHCHRRMIVTQRCIGEQTAGIAERAPKTWSYLQRHCALFRKRGSSIYRGKPEFSIFGVGDYSFSPWKIAISGMYKSLRFVKVGPFQAQPVVFDDTTNFIPCPSETAATLLLSLLESDEARTFYNAFIFWDAKRPITVDLLGRLNIHALAEPWRFQYVRPTLRPRNRYTLQKDSCSGWGNGNADALAAVSSRRVPQVPRCQVHGHPFAFGDLGGHEPPASDERAVGPTAGGCRSFPLPRAQWKNDERDLAPTGPICQACARSEPKIRQPPTPSPCGNHFSDPSIACNLHNINSLKFLHID